MPYIPIVRGAESLRDTELGLIGPKPNLDSNQSFGGYQSAKFDLLRLSTVFLAFHLF